MNFDKIIHTSHNLKQEIIKHCGKKIRELQIFRKIVRGFGTLLVGAYKNFTTVNKIRRLPRAEFRNHVQLYEKTIIA